MIETVVDCGMISMILISLLFSENSIKNLTPILTLFAVAALRVMPSLNRIFNAAIEFKQGTVFLEKVQEYQLSLKGMAKNSERKDQQIQKRGFSESVNFNLVAYRYPGTEKDVLNGITFSLKKGKSYAFVGSSGAGKSTLIDLLLGLLKPNSGSIKIDQIDLQEDIQGWQKNIGYVPQSIYLIDDSILKNVAFGVDENKIEESKVVSALKQAQLFDFIDRLPEKTQTQIGDRGIRLSGGQKQRLGIARALYSNPEVLIFDEATSSLDMETEKAITGSMNEISKDKTVIIIAHRLATVRGCDHIYFMSEGSIVGEGTFTELLEKNKRFFEFAMSGQS
jgi:ATP-binding cassette subfamily C protein